MLREVDLQTAVKGHRPADVRLLRRLGTAQQQDNKFRAAAGEIDPITWAEMYARLKYSAPDWLAITEVAIGHSLNGDEHTRLGSNIRQSN